MVVAYFANVSIHQQKRQRLICYMTPMFNICRQHVVSICCLLSLLNCLIHQLSCC